MDGALTFTHVCVDSSRIVLEHHKDYYIITTSPGPFPGCHILGMGLGRERLMRNYHYEVIKRRWEINWSGNSERKKFTLVYSVASQLIYGRQ